jgi:hypothetical protein
VRALSFHPAILSLTSPLTVRAVFVRTWHLVDASGMLLTVTTAPYDGPMAIRVENWLPGAARPGMTARLAGRALTLGALRLDLTGAREWRGEPAQVTPIDRSALERDLGLVAALTSTGALPGLAPRLEALESALRAHDAAAVQSAVRWLIGLGPGLTPAGDDVLCGLMAGLHVFGRRLVVSSTGVRADGVGDKWQAGTELAGDRRAKALGYAASRFPAGRVGWMRDRLGVVVLEEMQGRTTALSRTLLYWAARGVAVQPLLDVLWTLGSGGPVDGLETTAAMGHTSGRDMLAGASLAATLAVGGQGDASVVDSAERLP